MPESEVGELNKLRAKCFYYLAQHREGNEGGIMLECIAAGIGLLGNQDLARDVLEYLKEEGLVERPSRAPAYKISHDGRKFLEELERDNSAYQGLIPEGLREAIVMHDRYKGNANKL